MKKSVIRLVMLALIAVYGLSLRGQNRLAVTVGYEQLPAKFFSPTDVSSFNASLYRMDPFVSYRGSVAPSLGLQLAHQMGKKGMAYFGVDYTFMQANYQVENERYYFLYEGTNGRMTLKNHAVSLSGIFGRELYKKKRQKSRFYVGAGFFIGLNVDQSLTVPESDFKDEYNYYRLRDGGVNPIQFGTVFNVSWKYRYSGSYRKGDYFYVGLNMKNYSDGLIINNSEEAKGIWVPGIKIGLIR